MNANSGSEARTPTGSSDQEERAMPDNNGVFECNICLDTAKDAVVSMCGHLFCWPCLHQWLETRRDRQMCPVCKAGISKEKVIPLYGRGNNSQQDPREKIPPRPQGQRTEPQRMSNFVGFNLGEGGFPMFFGIGAFPFGYLTSSLNINSGRPPAPPLGSPQHFQEQFLNKVFIFIAVLLLVWLLLA